MKRNKPNRTTWRLVLSLAGLALLAAWVFSAQAHGAVVILNEYNAVDDNRWLDEDGLTGSDKRDTYFDRIEGNGGDWFELVVVGDGTAGSTVDMRGWEIRIDEDGGTGKGHLKLSDHDYWSNVTAGTILTFIETEDADGQGIDTSTEILKVDNLLTEGWAWTNIYADDPVYIDTDDPDHDPSYPITGDDTQLVIFQSDGTTVVFGPAGEGISPSGGVGSREVFKLEADPSSSITETSASYTDGTSSSFGGPNPWTTNDVSFRQDFSAFVVPEPGTIALLLSALVPLLWSRRRKRAG